MENFSEEEIQEQLAILGYKNIPKRRLCKFKQDLDELIRHGEWKTLASSTQSSSSTSLADVPQHSPPAYTKEIVSHFHVKDSGEGFFLHAARADSDRLAFTTCQSKGQHRQQARSNAYAQHSVAPKIQLPPGGPSRLQVESDPEDTDHPPLTDSYTSSPDNQGRRFMKRKVLRKHDGQSLVCDESIYSEDSARFGVATMYKMYSAQLDEESDDKNSLSSSFWSDGEKHDDEEEEVVKMEPAIDKEDSRPVAGAEDSLQEASEEEKLELFVQGDFHRESLEHETDEESCSSSSDSPAPSLLTSGYSTYRPEEHEGEACGEGHTLECDQDSRGDLSDMRDDEEDERSFWSFGRFDIVTTSEPNYHDAHLPSVLTDVKPEASMKYKEELKPEADTSQTDELHNESEKRDPEEGQRETLGEVQQDLKEQISADFEDPDESSSNTGIKFIDSKVDFSWMTFKKKCEEWEGNLRQKKETASCLEQRLADLYLSTSAQLNCETENQDTMSQCNAYSAAADGISPSAFESYIHGMTRSDGDLRPKPKSFIRPVMSQHTIKKTDPVAKYFQYKQLWEMFKLPGENDRRALRWEIREQLAYQPPPPKPRRVYMPNTYKVPTEKKRSALRWEIRNDLANGLLPHKFNYRF